jgi:hypothetical protein
MKPFNFSGNLKTLPELHKALMTIKASERMEKLKDVREIIKMKKDCFGCYDISRFGKRRYTSKVISFADYRIFVKDTHHKNVGGTINTYLALVLTKMKSEKCLKSARPTEKKVLD